MALLGKRQAVDSARTDQYFVDPVSGERIPDLIHRPASIDPRARLVLEALAAGDLDSAGDQVVSEQTAADFLAFSSDVTHLTELAEADVPTGLRGVDQGLLRAEVRKLADGVVERFPDHDRAQSFRCAALGMQGWSVRGRGGAATSAHTDAFLDLMRQAESGYRRAVHRGAGAEAHTLGIGTGMALGIPQEERMWRFEQAHRLDPFFVPAVAAVIEAASGRWGGPTGMSLGLARWVSAEAPAGHAAHGGIAIAHVEEAQFATSDVDAYFSDSGAQRELASTFDTLIESMPEPISRDHRWALSCFLFPLSKAELPGRLRYALSHLVESPDASVLRRHYDQSWDRQYQLARHRLGLLGVEPRQKLIGVDLSVDDWNSGRVMAGQSSAGIVP